MEKKIINIFYTRGTTPIQGTSHDEDAFYKQNKAPSPKVKGNFFFLASSTIHFTEHHVALHAKKTRRVTSQGTAANETGRCKI